MTRDVVVIGAGPVGLFAALLLGQAGCTVAIYERWPTFYPLSRACSIDHEIIRLLQGAGLADEFKSVIDPVIGPEKTYEFLSQSGETLLQIDWNRPGASGWAQMNMFHQPDLERMLVRRLEALPNVSIHRGWELTDICETPDCVSLSLKAAGGADACLQVQARYVVGADGARSTVRERLGIGQTDLGFAYDWLVVDVVMLKERVWSPYVVQHCDPDRPTTLVGGGPGRRRWEFMRLPGESNEELDTAEAAWRLLSRWEVTPEVAKLERHAVYTFRGAWSEEWRRGRAMLAGDAAHLMPPFLGQGLCSGMRDAAALSWRLATVLAGEAPDALLDSYGPERLEHVKEIINQAVEIGRVICELDPGEVAIRNAQMQARMRDPASALKPPPEPRLGGSGLWLSSDPNAGYLSVQGRVKGLGREGLYDDIYGSGWRLLVRRGPVPEFTIPVRRAAKHLGLVTTDFGLDGTVLDLDGVYTAWFKRLRADAVLVRPDLYVYGASDHQGAGALILSAAAAVAGAGAARTEEVDDAAAWSASPNMAAENRRCKVL